MRREEEKGVRKKNENLRVKKKKRNWVGSPSSENGEIGRAHV